MTRDFVQCFFLSLFIAAPAMAQSEGHLRQGLEGRYVVLKMDMPATKEGVNLRADNRFGEGVGPVFGVASEKVGGKLRVARIPGFLVGREKLLRLARAQPRRWPGNGAAFPVGFPGGAHKRLSSKVTLAGISDFNFAFAHYQTPVAPPTQAAFA